MGVSCSSVRTMGNTGSYSRAFYSTVTVLQSNDSYIQRYSEHRLHRHISVVMEVERKDRRGEERRGAGELSYPC